MSHSAALMAATPHARNHRQIADVLNSGKSIAFPGVFVRGAVWVATKHDDGQLEVKPDRIVPTHKAAKNQRFLPLLQSGIEEPRFIREAEHYAERNWPCNLAVDISQSSGWFELCNPAEANIEQGGCYPVAAGCATFRTALTPLLGLHPEQRSATLHRAVLRSSVVAIERDELLGPAPTLFRYCSRCGHWLQLDHCPGCKVDFPAFRVPHETGFVLPDALLIGWRQQRHTFESDPTRWR